MTSLLDNDTIKDLARRIALEATMLTRARPTTLVEVTRFSYVADSKHTYEEAYSSRSGRATLERENAQSVTLVFSHFEWQQRIRIAFTDDGRPVEAHVRAAALSLIVPNDEKLPGSGGGIRVTMLVGGHLRYSKKCSVEEGLKDILTMFAFSELRPAV